MRFNKLCTQSNAISRTDVSTSQRSGQSDGRILLANNYTSDPGTHSLHLFQKNAACFWSFLSSGFVPWGKDLSFHAQYKGMRTICEAKREGGLVSVHLHPSRRLFYSNIPTHWFESREVDLLVKKPVLWSWKLDLLRLRREWEESSYEWWLHAYWQRYLRNLEWLEGRFHHWSLVYRWIECNCQCSIRYSIISHKPLTTEVV